MGTTAKKIDRVWEQETALAELHVLTVRDAENLIPISIIEEAIHASSPLAEERINRLTFFKELLSGPSAKISSWLDIKEGLRPHKLPDHEPWNSQSQNLHARPFVLKEECETDCIEPRNCQCLLVPGLGDKLLAQVVEVLDQKTARKKAESFGAAYKEELEEIDSLVIAWCCAPPPTSA